MKKLLMAATAMLPFAAATPAFAEKAGDKIAGSYICVFNNNVSRGSAQAEANRSAQAAAAQLKHVYTHALRGFAVNAAPQAVENMKRANPNIAYCEQDQEVGFEQDSDALTFRQLGKPTAPAPSGQQLPWGVKRVNGGTGPTKTPRHPE